MIDLQWVCGAWYLSGSLLLLSWPVSHFGFVFTSRAEGKWHFWCHMSPWSQLRWLQVWRLKSHPGGESAEGVIRMRLREAEVWSVERWLPWLRLPLGRVVFAWCHPDLALCVMAPSEMTQDSSLYLKSVLASSALVVTLRATCSVTNPSNQKASVASWLGRRGRQSPCSKLPQQQLVSLRPLEG